MNITINKDYRITSDGQSIIVNERYFSDPTKAPNWNKRVKEAESEGTELPDASPKERWRELSYHGRLESALNSIVDRRIKTSEATDIEQLFIDIAEIKADIARALKT